MKRIGIALKEKRESLKLSLEDMEKKTLMPKERIQAIEEGNLDFFNDDLTYLKFYIRAYCKEVGVDFDVFKEEFNSSLAEYTMEMTKKNIDSHNKIEENIAMRKQTDFAVYAKKDRVSIKENTSKNKDKKRKPKKLDISLASLVIVAIVIIAIYIVFFFAKVINQEKPVNNENIIVEKTPPVEKEPTPEKEKEEVVEPVSSITVTEIAIDRYEISGGKIGDAFKLEIIFNERSWLNGSSNGVVIDSLLSNVFENGTTAIYENNTQAQEEIVLEFGNYRDITVKFNDEVVKINPAINQNSNTVRLVLVIKGAQ